MSRLRVRSYLTKSFSQSAHPGTSRPRGTGISPLSPLERFRAGLEEPTDLSKRDGYGYYPGTIGQRMAAGPDDDFIIVRKLGWGGTSNVWLARHEPHRSKMPLPAMAIKILNAYNTSGCLVGEMEEIYFLRRVSWGQEPPHRPAPTSGRSLAAKKAKSTDNPGFNHCMQLDSSFFIQSLHGHHLCMVTEALGPSLTRLPGYLELRVLPTQVVKTIVRQTLLALNYLHSSCGIIHCDLHANNILVKLSKAAKLKSVPKGDILESSVGEAVSQPLFFPELHDLSSIKISITDLGHANWVDKPLRHSPPSVMMPPEAILRYQNVSTATDIWALGCMVFELLAGTPLFGMRIIKDEQIVDSETVHIGLMLAYTGQTFPQKMFELAERSKVFLNNPGEIRLDYEIHPESVEELLADVLDEAEIESAASFIRRCLHLDPEQRPSAECLLADPWLTGSDIVI